LKEAFLGLRIDQIQTALKAFFMELGHKLIEEVVDVLVRLISNHSKLEESLADVLGFGR
jgi:hypothetical protein